DDQLTVVARLRGGERDPAAAVDAVLTTLVEMRAAVERFVGEQIGDHEAAHQERARERDRQFLAVVDLVPLPVAPPAVDTKSVIGRPEQRRVVETIQGDRRGLAHRLRLRTIRVPNGFPKIYRRG